MVHGSPCATVSLVIHSQVDSHSHQEANLKIFISFPGDESESKGLSGGVIAGIVLVLVFLIALVLVGIWYVRHRTRYYGGKSISYYKDMTTKPLEEDFDDEEAAKVFDHRGSREKVEFA